MKYDIQRVRGVLAERKWNSSAFGDYNAKRVRSWRTVSMLIQWFITIITDNWGKM